MRLGIGSAIFVGLCCCGLSSPVAAGTDRGRGDDVQPEMSWALQLLADAGFDPADFRCRAQRTLPVFSKGRSLTMPWGIACVPKSTTGAEGVARYPLGFSPMGAAAAWIWGDHVPSRFQREMIGLAEKAIFEVRPCWRNLPLLVYAFETRTTIGVGVSPFHDDDVPRLGRDFIVTIDKGTGKVVDVAPTGEVAVAIGPPCR